MLATKLLSLDSGIKKLSECSLESIKSFSHIEDPKDETVCFLSKKKYLNRIGRRTENKKFPNTLLIIASNLLDEVKEIQDLFNAVWVSENISSLIQKISINFYQSELGGLNNLLDGRQLGSAEIHPEANIAQNVFIGANCIIEENVEIHPGAVIYPNVHIKEGSIIFANVVLYPKTVIGKNCRIHSGTVIGADGYGYEFLDGEHKKIWHIGGVFIEDDVEIGSSSTIDMGIMHSTTIGKGTKIDSQVHIGHNCIIGAHCILCGQVGLAGSVTMEDFCVLGGRAAIGPDAYLESAVQIAGAAVVNDGAHLKAKSVVGGFPARPIKQWMKETAFLSLAIKNRGK